MKKRMVTREVRTKMVRMKTDADTPTPYSEKCYELHLVAGFLHDKATLAAKRY